jgi:hypothetical protein
MLKIIQPIIKELVKLSAGNQYYLRCFIIFLVVVNISGTMGYAQEVSPLKDTQEVSIDNDEPEARRRDRYSDHSPQKATLLSATLPGMGQIYNGRGWKVPIIYAGFGTIVYLVRFNNTNYQEFRQAYMARVDGNPNTIPDEKFEFYRTDNLKNGMNFYRRNLEITFIAAVALYVLNILDATVDAHLLDFDVGEDLALKLRPSLTPANQCNMTLQNPAAGFTLTLRF